MPISVEHLEDRRLLCGADVETGAPASPAFGTADHGADVHPTRPAASPAASATVGAAAGASASAAGPAVGLPALNSRPGAYAHLYLDFAGEPAATWNFGGGTYDVPATPAFTQDADPHSFSASELDAVRKVWAVVAEKYAPFHLNVTTVDPGDLADRRVQKVVIGGSGTWLDQDAGGVGTYGGFVNGASNVAYVFSDRARQRPDVLGDAASHEAGHGFGLNHQSLYNEFGDKEGEYNPGTSAAAPVMGFNASSARHVWWRGVDANGNWQNDADVIASTRNGFGYRPDDHGLTAALSANGSLATAAGLIGRPGDVDGFVFNTNGAESVGLRVSVPPFVTTLDARFEVRTNADAGYKVMARADGSTWNETLSLLKLPAGTYRLVVSGSTAAGGAGEALGSYEARVVAARTSAASYTVDEGGKVSLSAAGPNGPAYAWDLDGDGTFGETGPGAARGNEAGRTVTFNAAGLDGPFDAHVKLRVADGPAASVTSARVTVRNVAPRLAINGAATAATGAAYALALTATDPGPDAVAGWTIRWGDGSPDTFVAGRNPTVTHAFKSAGTFAISATARDEDGSYATFGPRVTVGAAGPPVVPPPVTPPPVTPGGALASADIGPVGVAGRFAAGPVAGSYVLAGAGADISGSRDAFRFASRSLAGDGQVVARVASFDAARPWAKAGVMIRAGADVNAANAFVCVTPGHGIVFATRSSAGAWTATTTAAGGAPSWVKLVRRGNEVSGYASADGSHWTLLGRRTIALGPAALAGLAVTSQHAGTLATATFAGAAIGALPATLAATDDAFVRDGEYQHHRYGADPSLVVKRSATGFGRESFVKFDLSSLGQAGRVVLKVFGRTDGPPVRVAVAGAASTWSESTMSWAARPASAGPSVGAVTVTSASAWREWDVTAFVRAQQAAGRSSAAFALRALDAGSAVAWFDSSESANAPRLVIG